MATRDVTVRLSAKVDAYVAAMNRARSATGQLSQQSVRNMAQVGSSMQRMGRTASLTVTAPLVALGGASVGMAHDFERSFSTMEGLANVPAGEVDKLKEAVLGLAGETAVAPQELADALYFAASAGLDSAQAMDVLERSARATAAGMGDTSSIVGLVAGAVAAYGPEVLSAAEATDILTAAIREGRSDPQELAGALGRVTPIAAAMGVSFGEMAGAAAYMSNIIGNTDETITALRGVLLAMLDPTKQAKDALLSIGTSADELQSILSTQGLVAAFQHLKEHGLNPNSEAMSNLFEDNRALNGAMILLNDESGRLAPVIDAVTNSVGSLDEAFAAVADDEGFKMRQAIVDIQVAMTKLGTVLLPLAADIASALSNMVDWFLDLPEPVQQLTGVLALLAAAGGPVLIMVGSLVKNFGLVSTAFGKLSPGMQGFAGTLAKVGIVALVAKTAWDILGEGHLNASAHIDTASTALQTETVAAYNAAVAAGMATTEVDALAIAHEALSNAIAEAADEELSTSMDTLNVAASDYLDTLLAFPPSTKMWENAEAIKLTEEYFGLAAGEGAIFLEVMYNSGASVAELANIIGASEEEVVAFSEALQTVSTYAMENRHEVDALSLTFLDAQARAGGAAREALLLAEGIAGGRREAGNATNVYVEFLKQLMLMEPAERDAIINTDAFATSLAELPPELAAGVEGLEGFGYQTEQVAMRQSDAIDTMSDYMDAVNDTATAIGFYTDAIETTFGPMQALERARDDVRESVFLFADSLDDESRSMADNTKEGLANRAALMDAADSVLDFAKAQLESGMAVESVQADYEKNIEWLRDTAIAAGLAEEDVDNLLETYGMTPEQLNTAINLAGDALAKWRVDRYLEKLDEIPESDAVHIETLIDEGKYDEALAYLEAIPDQTVNVYANPVGFNAFGGRFSLAEHAQGGYVNRPMISTLGEGGLPEVVLPLSIPHRMDSLLSMPQVQPAVLAALGRIGTLSPSPSSPAMMGSVAQSAPINVYVYNYGKRELTSRDVEIALVNAGVGGR